jgi:hypothetical protein
MLGWRSAVALSAVIALSEVPTLQSFSEPATRRGPSVLAACAAAVLAVLAAPLAAAAVAPHPLVEVPFFAGRDVVSLAVDAGEPSRTYVVADASLYVSDDDGATWQALDTPPTAADQSTVDAVSAHPWVDGLVFVSVVTHLARSADGGDTWHELGTGCVRPHELGFGIEAPDRFYASGPALLGSCFAQPVPACGIVRGDGTEPTACISQPSGPEATAALLVDPADADRLLAAGARSLFRSEDAGATWSEITTAPAGIADLRLHPGDPRTVWAATFGEGLWRSGDFGTTWERVDDGLFVDRIVKLEVDPVDPATLHVIVDFANGLWTSRDGGVTWQPQWVGLPNSFLNDVAVDPADPGVLLIATDDGLYRRELVDDRPCVADATTLCLLDGRVRVQVAWRAFDGSSGLGAAVPQTGETGWFWFFDEENPELVVKALDGREVNGHLWLFYGSLTNVEMTITATDTVGGEIESFYNPPRRFASAGHTAVFVRPVPLRTPGAAASPGGAAPAAWAPPLALSTPTVAPAHGGPCGDPAALCLHDRFRVTVEWEDFFGNTGQGVPLPLTDDAGFFWFFEAGNLELVVKVLDAEPVNGHWWVFYGALSNVAYTLRVEDTATGLVREYENPLRHFGSRGDTAAFPSGEAP